ncbi:hypothetical protein ENBRE01_2291 [Enteropsectra breve]|nr:hypothetical protein ENBRE01_2291 [Enteropsectra breve]
MDAGIIANFKLDYQRSLVMELVRCTDLKETFSVSVFDAIHKIKDAWTKVTMETIFNCFKHAFLKTTIRK